MLVLFTCGYLHGDPDSRTSCPTTSRIQLPQARGPPIAAAAHSMHPFGPASQWDGLLRRRPLLSWKEWGIITRDTRTCCTASMRTWCNWSWTSWRTCQPSTPMRNWRSGSCRPSRRKHTSLSSSSWLFRPPTRSGQRQSALLAAMPEHSPRDEGKSRIFACHFLQRLPRKLWLLLMHENLMDLKVWRPRWARAAILYTFVSWFEKD